MRFRLRTLMIVLALGPPLIALAWWFGQHIPAWVLFLLFIALLPEVGFRLFGYSFYLLCRVAAGRPPNDKDSK